MAAVLGEPFAWEHERIARRLLVRVALDKDAHLLELALSDRVGEVTAAVVPRLRLTAACLRAKASVAEFYAEGPIRRDVDISSLSAPCAEPFAATGRYAFHDLVALVRPAAKRGAPAREAVVVLRGVLGVRGQQAAALSLTGRQGVGIGAWRGGGG